MRSGWDVEDRFTAEFVERIRREASGYPPEDREAEVAPLFATSLFGNVSTARFPNAHTLDLQQLLARVGSISYIATAGEAWEHVRSDTERLFHEYADASGHVTHRYFTSIFIAERVNRRKLGSHLET